MQTISEVPNVTIAFAGREGNFYQFRVSNFSSHNITALAVRLVSGGTNLSIGDNGSPVVKGSQAKDLKFEISSVGVGDVIVEAAVFDDESFGGEERTAATLVARQIGNQAEYDRIVSTVEEIIASHVDPIEKTFRVRRALSELSENVDAAMIRTFNRWFPDLVDCSQRYLRRMKGAAVAEKANVVESIEQFAHSAAPGLPSLEQWWASTKQTLVNFGCTGCAAQASNPKSPSNQQVSALGCKPDAEKLVLVFTAELTDDSFASDTAENDDPDLTPEDVAAANLENKHPLNSRPVPPPPRVVPAEAATIVSQPEKRESALKPLPENVAVYPITPKPGVAYVSSPDGRLLLYRMRLDHPAPDYDVFAALFQDIDALGNDALYEEVEIRGSETLVVGHDPPAGGLDDSQVKILRQAARACNQELAALHKKETNLYSAYAGFPMGSMAYAPPNPEIQRLRDERNRTLIRYIKSLHLQLGAASFVKLEGFARKVYRAAPGRYRIIPISDDGVYYSFLRYINMLGQTPAAQREQAKRQQELAIAGLGKDGWDTLKEVALSFDRAENNRDAKYRKLQADSWLAPRSASIGQGVSSGASIYGAASLPVANGAAAASMPIPMPPPAGAVAGQGSQSIGALATRDVRAAEFTKFVDDGKLITSEHIKRLQTELGKADFQKLDKYVHQLYAHVGQTTFIATGAQASQSPGTQGSKMP